MTKQVLKCMCPAQQPCYQLTNIANTGAGSVLAVIEKHSVRPMHGGPVESLAFSHLTLTDCERNASLGPRLRTV